MAHHTLLIMRHADAEPAEPGQPDVQRRLTAAGHDRAASQADVVRAHAPQVVLCSAAVRATQTLSHLDLDDAAVHVEPDLYGASPMEVLQRLGQVAADVTTVLLVGHLPTVAEVTAALLARPGVGAGDQVDIMGFSPGAVAVLELPGPWGDLQPASAQLRHFG